MPGLERRNGPRRVWPGPSRAHRTIGRWAGPVVAGKFAAAPDGGADRRWPSIDPGPCQWPCAGGRLEFSEAAPDDRNGLGSSLSASSRSKSSDAFPRICIPDRQAGLGKLDLACPARWRMRSSANCSGLRWDVRVLRVKCRWRTASSAAAKRRYGSYTGLRAGVSRPWHPDRRLSRTRQGPQAFVVWGVIIRS
jgi:hypothetical protein